MRCSDCTHYDTDYAPKCGCRCHLKLPSGYKLAPSDVEANRLYVQALAMAEAGGLIVQAYGGVATIAVPEEQRKAGIRDRVLEAHMMKEQS